MHGSLSQLSHTTTHPAGPYSLTLKMEASHYFETPEHSFRNKRKLPRGGQMFPLYVYRSIDHLICYVAVFLWPRAARTATSRSKRPSARIGVIRCFPAAIPCPVLT
jgi:hypothetical protein